MWGVAAVKGMIRQRRPNPNPSPSPRDDCGVLRELEAVKGVIRQRRQGAKGSR